MASDHAGLQVPTDSGAACGGTACGQGVFWGFLLMSVGETLGRAERPAGAVLPRVSRLKYMSPFNKLSCFKELEGPSTF